MTDGARVSARRFEPTPAPGVWAHAHPIARLLRGRGRRAEHGAHDDREPSGAHGSLEQTRRVLLPSEDATRARPKRRGAIQRLTAANSPPRRRPRPTETRTTPSTGTPRCFGRFVDFDGRARRKEYGWFTFVNLLGVVAMTVGGAVLADDPDSPAASVPFWIYAAATFLPSLSVSVRRLHDTGRSGGWVFLQLIPYVGALVLLVFMVMDGDPGSNQYAPNPKAPQVDLGELEEIFA